MAGLFIADEVLQMAMQLEETGQLLYEAVAATCGSEPVAELCRRLAKEEVEHYNTFKRMRQELADRPESRPVTREELKSAQAVINERVVPDPMELGRVARQGSLEEVLELSIQLEDDSVAFYAYLLAAMEGEDAEVVERIITEEQQHARDLREARRGL